MHALRMQFLLILFSSRPLLLASLPTQHASNGSLTIHVCYYNENDTIKSIPATMTVREFVKEHIVTNQKFLGPYKGMRTIDPDRRQGIKGWWRRFWKRQILIYVLPPDLLKLPESDRKAAAKKQSFKLRNKSQEAIGQRVKTGSMLVLGTRMTNCDFDQLNEDHPWRMEKAWRTLGKDPKDRGWWAGLILSILSASF